MAISFVASMIGGDVAAQDLAQSGGLPYPLSVDVAVVADSVIRTGDNERRPFMIIDKVQAQVFVFGADGRLIADAPALLGLALGDESIPGIGERALSDIRPEERTTPAGRFIAGFRPSRNKRDVFWVDYETAVSLHEVVTANRQEMRLQRLQSPTPQDNRITYGCINVPAAFYEEIVLPIFSGATSIVYVLPDTKRLNDVFPTLMLPEQARIGDPGGQGAEPATTNAEGASGSSEPLSLSPDEDGSDPMESILESLRLFPNGAP